MDPDEPTTSSARQHRQSDFDGKMPANLNADAGLIPQIDK